CYQHSTGYTF
nr:immunoglobulin light chain junction region [Macaca mulatta]